MLQTEHDFTLPMGYLDKDGNLHRDGVMRLATAADEILPLKDPRVQKNPAYLAVILLSRVVARRPETMGGTAVAVGRGRWRRHDARSCSPRNGRPIGRRWLRFHQRC